MKNGTRTHLRPAPHSLSALHTAHVASDARLVLVHVDVSGSHAVSPQRIASVAGVHATHAPALHTGLPVTCWQSLSTWQVVHAFASQREASARLQSTFVLHSTHVVALLLHTVPALTQTACSALVQATQLPCTGSQTEASA